MNYIELFRIAGTVGKDIPGHKLLIVKKVLTVLESLLTQGKSWLSAYSYYS